MFYKVIYEKIDYTHVYVLKEKIMTKECTEHDSMII